MGWSRKCEKRGKHWLRAAALGVVFLWTAGSSLQAEAESSKSAHWHKGVGVEAWLTGADKEQVSPNAAFQNDAADAATGAVGGQETDVASDSADSKTKASSGDGTKMDDLTGTIVMTSVQNRTARQSLQGICMQTVAVQCWNKGMDGQSLSPAN